MVRPTVRPKTVATYASILRTHVYSHAIAAMRVDTIRTTHLRLFFRDLEQRDVGARLRQVVFIRLKAAFTASGLSPNPMTGVPHPRVPRRSMTTWSADEARAFLEATAGDEFAALYRLSLSALMRGASCSRCNGAT